MSESGSAAAVVAIGDELLAGSHPDLNSPHLAAELGRRGLPVREVSVLGDDEEPLARRLSELCQRHALVLATGGLGPTLDDVTRHAAAAAAGVELERSEEVADGLARYFERQGRAMAQANERQALFPKGAVVLPNHRGTAPGFRVRVGACWLVCLPGPPPELQAMVAATLLPWLEAEGLLGRGVREQAFHLVGLPESRFAEEVGDWMARTADPVLGVTAKRGTLSARLRSTGSDPESVARFERRCVEFRERLARWVFSEDEPRLELATGRALLEAGRSVATAESCTGGLVAYLLARTPGISAVLRAGLCTYTNELKTSLLGVDAGLLAEHGAVSSPVAAEMARGAARASGAELTVSTTGIAGPDGGSEQKPVGRVHFGIFDRGEVRTFERTFPNVGREGVQRFAANTALSLLLGALKPS